MKGWCKQLILILVLTAPVRGQETDLRRVEVNVVTVSGLSVYIDAGREAGVEPGDRLRLFPSTGATFETRIVAITKSGARAELDSSEAGVQTGDRGLVFVPQERINTGSATEPTRSEGSGASTSAPGRAETPEHPPWESDEVQWDADVPLLAPVVARAPEERASRFFGRLTTMVQHTWDNESDSRYLNARAGLNLEWENPLGRADFLNFRAESDLRHTHLTQGSDEDETNLRIERLSYGWGGGRAGRNRFEFGRFLQSEFPEFGIIDGVEFIQRSSARDRFGLSIGLQPEPDDEMEVNGDFQIAATYQWLSDAEGTVALGAGVQKTWHDGRSDRELLLLKAQASLSERSTLHSTLWIDHYGSSQGDRDTIELTQALVDARWNGDGGTGAGLSFLRLRWPELLRDEFDPLTIQQLEDNELTRVSASGWTRLRGDIRLSIRGDLWEDQDDSGSHLELTARLRNRLWDDGEVALGIYSSEAEFQDTNGLRCSATKQLALGFLSASYEAAFVDRPDTLDGEDAPVNQLLRASYDRGLGRHWNASFFFEQRFGDEVDSLTAGLSMSRSF